MDDSLTHAPDVAESDDRLPSVWRIRVVAIMVGIAGCILAGRLVQVQWWQHDQFAERADRIQTWSEPVAARPGEIVDREMRVLATSTPASSLFLDPQRVEDPDDIAQRLGSVLPIDAERLASRIRSSSQSRFLWVQRRLTDDEAAAVKSLGLPKSCYGFRDEFRRHYPQGAIAAHVLGLRNIDNQGQGGLEENYDSTLSGIAGERIVRRDAQGFVLEVLGADSRSPGHGGRIQTTLDGLLQLQVEERLDAVMTEWQPKSCTAIVMTPEQGEILTLACRPAFDPNAPQRATANAWKNQAIASVFEPGSTFKPFVVAWAVDRGLLARDESLHCGWGAYRMGRRVLHDHHAYGELSVTDVLVKSSNIGMAKIGERLTNSGLQELCTAFGFGRPTGIGLPGELPGLVRPFDDWNSYSTGSIPMGQELAATPLQIIAAHAALANGGRLVTPRLIRRIEGADRNASPGVIPVVAPIVSAETAAWLVEGPMREVVTRGTGKAAQIPGYSVFGKTGTAQVVDVQTGNYSHNRHICSFLCGAPAATPRVLVLVVVEEPQGPGVQYGGTVAAPPARDILELSLTRLQVPPDIPSQVVPRTTSRPTKSTLGPH
ncbi:MAG: penicillin-binding protein 2 [Planctomycetaceae bacterium]|nr:penicillin-binding protein 2 [Planctomycetaceae bacterium]